MSRKKFTAGIGYLFEDETDADILSEESVLLSASNVSDKKPRQQASRAAATHGKKFASDLELFLKEAFEESYEAQMQEEASDALPKKRSRRPDSGLDLLIRSTVEPVAISDNNTPERRVTLLIDQLKLEKLKTIAKLERTYIKNIMDDIVQEFIKSYEKKKGNLK